jgi:hypothetical protein
LYFVIFLLRHRQNAWIPLTIQSGRIIRLGTSFEVLGASEAFTAAIALIKPSSNSLTNEFMSILVIVF